MADQVSGVGSLIRCIVDGGKALYWARVGVRATETRLPRIPDKTGKMLTWTVLSRLATRAIGRPGSSSGNDARRQWRAR